jgi:YHS domain-containing protein
MHGIFKQGEKSTRQPEPEELVQDPSCQIYIPKRIAARKRVAGRDYYFCSQACLRKFLDEKKF